MKGTVKLYYMAHDHNYKVEEYFYSDPTDRKRVIEIWRRTYGDRFPLHFLRIAPDVNLTGKLGNIKKAI